MPDEEEPVEEAQETTPVPSPAETNASWQRVQLARHPKRPHSLDYIRALITGFEELHGDRFFGDDKSIVAGMGFFESAPVMIIGQQKGRDTKEKLHRNFGMPKPDGYRKAGLSSPSSIPSELIQGSKRRNAAKPKLLLTICGKCRA